MKQNSDLSKWKISFLCKRCSKILNYTVNLKKLKMKYENFRDTFLTKTKANETRP